MTFVFDLAFHTLNIYTGILGNYSLVLYV